jgi:beta-lactamase regulating signal transducer with metallopeptidase domain/HEAT repeat protein
MSFSFDFPQAPSAMATFALLALLKVTFVLLVSLAATALMRRASAGARHMVWLVALIAALALPSWSMWSPLPVRVLPAVVQPVVPTIATGSARTQSPVTVNGGAAPTAAPVVPIASRSSRRPIGIGILCLALWSLLAVALLGRLAAGAWMLRRIVRRARALDQPNWQRPLLEIADRLGLDDAPRLVQSDQIKMPFATGFLNAVIVLPLESDSWSTERRCAVLIHELAHVKRRDLAGHLVSRIACALYWFHPLVWTAARHLRAESERACDDLALVLGTRAAEYAEHLLNIVKEVRDDRMPAVALAMAKPGEFEGRMLAILDPRRRRRGPGRVQAVWLVGALTALALAVGALAPARRAAATPPAPDSGASRALPGIANENVDPKPADDPKPALEPGDAKSEEGSDASARSSDAAARDRGKADAATEVANEVHRAEVLVRTLRTDPDAEVRRIAAWGLGSNAESDVAVQGLVEAVAREQDEEVREMATWALAECQSPAAAAALEAAFRRDKSAKVRRTAAWAAGTIGSATSVEGLTALLTDPDPDMREVAAWSIGSCSPEKAPVALVRALGDANRDVRLSAAWALHTIGDPSTADELEAAFRREKDPEVQRGLIRALGSMGDDAIPTLTRLVDSPDREIRAVAIAALAGHDAGGPWPWPRPEPRPYP